MLTAQLVLLSLAALVSLLFGIRYLVTRQFMPYHAAVAGKAWQDIEPGLQTIILGMLKILAGGFLAYGIALLWLLIPLAQKQAWAPWAVITITLASVLPSVYVTIWLRRFAPSAPTPVAPALAVLVVALVGGALSFVV
ncbi:MAG TPA: hypothetical protein VE935_07220 [Burkholderiales bacterium]|jgi:hypothetical protein|nr:hypothetical protein [Burkholderiales bacterium]